MSTAYRIELRRSPLRWWLVPLVLLDLAVLLGRESWWIGVWPQASAAVQIPSTYLGPVLAMAAAWVAGRSVHRGAVPQLDAAARPRWRAELAQLGATLSYGLLAYLTGAGVAAAVSSAEAGPGFLWPGYLLLGATTVTGCAAVGHAVGRYAGASVVAPLVCGLLCFAVLGELGDPRALGLFVLSGDPQLALSPAALAARVALGLALVAVAVAPVLRRGAAGRGPGATGRLATAGAALSVICALVLLGAAGPLRVLRERPSTPACSTTAPRVCLWPEDRKYLDEVSAMASRLAAIPAGLVTLPDTFYEQGLRGPAEAQNDFRVIAGDMWSVSPSMAAAIVQETLPTLCRATDPAAEHGRTAAYFQLSSWLEARANGTGQPDTVHGGPPGVDLAAIGKLITRPEPVQAAWAHRHLRTIRDTPCA